LADWWFVMRSKEIGRTLKKLYFAFFGILFFLLAMLVIFSVAINSYFMNKDVVTISKAVERFVVTHDNRVAILLLTDGVVNNDFFRITYFPVGGEASVVIGQNESENVWKIFSVSKTHYFDDVGKLKFEYYPFAWIWYATVFWVIIVLITIPLLFYFKKKMGEDYQKELAMQKAKSLADIASQVSHDIRSPLAALDMAIKEANELPEELRLIVRSSVSRIRDIANNLLSNNRASLSDRVSADSIKNEEIVLLSSVIETLVSEKRMQYRSRLGVKIEFDITMDGYGLFSRVNPIEFKRVLSNLINNSIDAINDNGNVRVALASVKDKVEIKISDNGKGIAPELLARIGRKGESFGKVGGNGIGLYHAITTIESWGGGLKIDSAVGGGTTVTISLLKSPSPLWFVKELVVKRGSRIVVIDDDSSIHQIWNGRFQSAIPLDANIEVVHLTTPELAREWFKESERERDEQSDTIYLVDFEFLGSTTNGIMLIKEFGIEKYSCLVTSRYEETHVLQKCRDNNISLIPKNLSAFIPVKVESKNDFVEYVYIDDDMLLRMGWESIAKRKNIKLLVLESPKYFAAHIEKIDVVKTKIYIDSNLGEDEIKGEDFAKELHDKGYQQIFIATGYSKEKFAHLPWLNYSGKDCPFDT